MYVLQGLKIQADDLIKNDKMKCSTDNPRKIPTEYHRKIEIAHLIYLQRTS